MKGFKHTGRGPRYGGFSFPSKAGFSTSSGKVKVIGSHTRRAPLKKSVGGLASSAPFEGKNQGFSKGGVARKVTGAAITKEERKALERKSVRASQTPAEAKKRLDSAKRRFAD